VGKGGLDDVLLSEHQYIAYYLGDLVSIVLLGKEANCTRQTLYRIGFTADIEPGRVESWRGSPLGLALSLSRVSPFVPG